MTTQKTVYFLVMFSKANYKRYIKVDTLFRKQFRQLDKR